MRHYVVIASRGLTEQAFEDWVVGALADGPVHIHLVVPTVAVEGRINWTEEEAREIARRRLRTAVRHLRDLGALAAGEVSSENLLPVVSVALRRRGYDAVVGVDDPMLLSVA